MTMKESFEKYWLCKLYVIVCVWEGAQLYTSRTLILTVDIYIYSRLPVQKSLVGTARTRLCKADPNSPSGITINTNSKCRQCKVSC